MRIAKLTFIFFGVFAALTLIGVFVILSYHSKDLPSLDAIKHYTPRIVTTVYSEDEKVIAEFSTERRMTITPEEIPENVINSFIAAEDKEFFTHRGINPITIVRAFIRNLQAGSTVQGGSTITQQVAKSILLTPEKSYSRKIKEMLLAFKIEKVLTKKEILNLYLNHIFLGNQAYGIESAAQVYFGKNSRELSVPEAAMLAGLPQAPSRYNPIQRPIEAKRRQRYVLERMLDEGMISKGDYESHLVEALKIKNSIERTDFSAPYFTEHVRRYLIRKYGADTLYGGGLKVYTTMDITAQTAAQDAINAGLIATDKRQGMRRPEKTLKTQEERTQFLRKQHTELVNQFYDYKLLTESGTLTDAIDEKQATPIEIGKNYQALVLELNQTTKNIVTQIGTRRGIIRPDDYRWTAEANPEEIYAQKIVRNPLNELSVGDLVTIQVKSLANDPKKPELVDEYFLEQTPLVQGALLSYRIQDGAVLAMVGGYDFSVTRSEFNRATQAIRQPGSTFKPFVYGAAIEAGLTASTMIVDSPIVYKDVDEQTHLEKIWRPDNYSEKFYGDTSLRNSLTYSRNIPTIKLLQHVGIQNVIDYSRKLGIKSELNADLSLALGSNGLSLEELMKGWGVFAKQGTKFETHFIKRIIDRDGKILEEQQPSTPEAVIPRAHAYIMTSLLQSVVEHGTATSVKALGRPIAGKTGTSNDFKDALFLGYIPQIFTGIWVGFDESRPIGRNEAGGKAAAPIWLQYMQVASANLPIQDFEVPEDVIRVQVDAETGDIPTPSTTRRLWEVYAKGTAPGQPSMRGFSSAQTQYAANSINKTQVVTGNKNRPSRFQESAGDFKPSEDDGSDELIRDDL